MELHSQFLQQFTCGNFLGALFLYAASRDMFYIPACILPKRRAAWDKEMLHIFMVAYSVDSSSKKYSRVQLIHNKFKSEVFFISSSVLMYSANKATSLLFAYIKYGW